MIFFNLNNVALVIGQNGFEFKKISVVVNCYFIQYFVETSYSTVSTIWPFGTSSNPAL